MSEFGERKPNVAADNWNQRISQPETGRFLILTHGVLPRRNAPALWTAVARHRFSPTRHVASSQSADMSAHSKMNSRPPMFMLLRASWNNYSCILKLHLKHFAALSTYSAFIG